MNIENSLSIVTVNYNSGPKLRATLESVNELKLKSKLDIEYILIDAMSEDLDLSQIEKIVDKFICEKDNGIYDAMNKGILVASKSKILFLNSGDTIRNVGELDTLKSGKILCYLGASRKPFWGRPLCLGTPYCHQQIIFPTNKEIFYDLKYEIAADLKYMIDMKCHTHLQKVSGLIVHYDLEGVSQRLAMQRDEEIYQILSEYKLRGHAIIFLIKMLISRVIKWVL